MSSALKEVIMMFKLTITDNTDREVFNISRVCDKITVQADIDNHLLTHRVINNGNVVLTITYDISNLARLFETVGYGKNS